MCLFQSPRVFGRHDNIPHNWSLLFWLLLQNSRLSNCGFLFSWALMGTVTFRICGAFVPQNWSVPQEPCFRCRCKGNSWPQMSCKICSEELRLGSNQHWAPCHQVASCLKSMGSGLTFNLWQLCLAFPDRILLCGPPWLGGQAICARIEGFCFFRFGFFFHWFGFSWN